MQIEVTSVPRDELEVHILPGAADAIVDRFVRGDRVCFPRHPLNTDSSVAWFDAPVAERWTARFTSSRTLALPGPESGAALSSLKLATDHPHPDFHQPEKTKLREEAIGAVEWVRILSRIDRLLEPLVDVELVTEVLVVLAAGRESGFMVRDLRLFQDGHYYLPALSLPWVGRQIARANGDGLRVVLGTMLRRARGSSQGTIVRPLRPLVRDAEPAERPDPARPRAPADRHARVPRRGRRRICAPMRG